MVTFLYNISFKLTAGIVITQDMINRLAEADLDVRIESGDNYKGTGFVVSLERFATIDSPMDEAKMINLATILFGTEKVQINSATYLQTSPNNSGVIHGRAFEPADLRAGLPKDFLGDRGVGNV
jgi:hypothetical protein